LRAVADEGYDIPTPIQKQAIPAVLAGKDLLGLAQTGTGKTAAFALPIMQLLDAAGKPRPPKGARCLILAPTRELAIQVEQSFTAYGRHMHLRSTCIFGGVSDFHQKEKLRSGVDILVATPGRLLDLIGQGALSLSHVEIFVLDEADRMLDMGFIRDIRKVVAKLPAKRQNLFFSATMPADIAHLAGSILHHPVRVEVTPQGTPIEVIDQKLYLVDKKSKPALLLHLLKEPPVTRALVFSRTKHGANKLCLYLERGGVQAAAIHGNKSQNRRQEALQGFIAGNIRVLVATDIAARGLDVDNISHVFNYDLPDVPETYVHRIGRTARAGAGGFAVAFCCSEEQGELRDIERLLKKPIPRGTVQGIVLDSISEQAPERPAPRHSAPHGHRPSRPNHPSHSSAPSHQAHRPKPHHQGSAHAPLPHHAAPARPPRPHQQGSARQPRPHQGQGHSRPAGGGQHGNQSSGSHHGRSGQAPAPKGWGR
jgi:ATP-dependent RNA helicase RhlE